MTLRSSHPLAAAGARESACGPAKRSGARCGPPGQRTRPLMPLRRGHLAMLVAAGFLDYLVPEADGQHIPVKGRTTKELVLAGEMENTEVYRERLKTTVVALDLDDGEVADIAA